METRKYEGKDFIVTIDRNCMERRYVLSTLEEDGSWADKNEPFKTKDFEKHYRFSPEWPYETI